MKRYSMMIVAWLLAVTAAAQASRIQDVTRLKGDQPNEIVGFGIVVGLKGTGDGGDSMPTMRPLMQLMGKFGDPVTLAKEMKNVNNVAIVLISATIPAHGAHEGDRLDVRVSAVGGAKSLKGGRLFPAPLQSPQPNLRTIFAVASGNITIDDDGTPTQAVIYSGRTGGAQMLEDVIPDNYSSGRFTLVLSPEFASFARATAIADQINEDVAPQTDGKAVAVAVDATSVIVTIPPAEITRPAQFVTRVQTLPVPNLPGKARVVVNSKTKTIVFSGEVELEPTVLTHNGLTINITAPNQPANPPGTQVNFVAIDPDRKGGAKLRDLLDAFNLLKVTPDDRIAIVKTLHAGGHLRAELVVD